MSLTTQNPQHTTSVMIRTMLISFCFWVVGTAHAQTLTVTLTASDYHGFNVRCFGGKSGTIDATVTGGTAPYTYLWTSGQTTEDLADMPSGYYKVAVYDANNVLGDAAITLTEPEPLKVGAEALKYPSGDNISCYDCYNGSIDVTVLQGVPPYSYVWGDDVFTQDRSGLGPYSYGVVVTDLNGCVQKSEPLFLKQPDSKDWKMGGNTNINPATQYLGTNDSSDLVFKSNGQEALRLESNGDIKLSGSLIGAGLLSRDGNGNLKVLDLDLPPMPVGPCADGIQPVWGTNGNNLSTCGGCMGRLGSHDDCDMNIMSNNITRLRLNAGGRVLVGGDLDQWPMGDPVGRVSIQQGVNGYWLTLNERLSPPNTPSGYWGMRNPVEGDRMAFDYVGPDGIAVNNILSLSKDGKVGIGITTPVDRLTVAGGGRPSMSLLNSSSTSAGGSIYYRKGDNTISWELATDLSSDGGQNFYIRDKVADVNRIFIDENGRVAIGDVSTPEGYMLAVQGGIQTEQVKVSIYSAGQWNDHVFAPEYELPTLAAVEAFIVENGHLQGIPSADCMVEDGLDVAKMDAALLLQIEEMTLHLIALEKRLIFLESENAQLERLIIPSKQ